MFVAHATEAHQSKAAPKARGGQSSATGLQLAPSCCQCVARKEDGDARSRFKTPWPSSHPVDVACQGGLGEQWKSFPAAAAPSGGASSPGSAAPCGEPRARPRAEGAGAAAGPHSPAHSCGHVESRAVRNGIGGMQMEACQSFCTLAN